MRAWVAKYMVLGLVLLAACGSGSSIADAPVDQTTAPDISTTLPPPSTTIAPTTSVEPTTTASTTTSTTTTSTTIVTTTAPVALHDCGDELDYRPIVVGTSPVCVAGALDRDPALKSRVLEQLEIDLARLNSVLPAAAIPFTETVTIWLERDIVDFPGGVYHPSEQWLSENGYPPEWAGGIQFGNANNYLTWIAQQPAMLLHEMAHAWHHQELGYDYAPIDDAYSAAMSEGLYDSVEYIEGGVLEAYATTNSQEYFAELTEALFWVNDYYPFDFQQLSDHDPIGEQVVATAWGLNR